MIIFIIVGACLLRDAFASSMAALSMLEVMHCAEESRPVTAWASWLVCVTEGDVVDNCGV